MCIRDRWKLGRCPLSWISPDFNSVTCGNPQCVAVAISAKSNNLQLSFWRLKKFMGGGSFVTGRWRELYQILWGRRSTYSHIPWLCPWLWVTWLEDFLTLKWPGSFTALAPPLAVVWRIARTLYTDPRHFRWCLIWHCVCMCVCTLHHWMNSTQCWSN